jgi:tetratricopeptide (TPR) repeat protein
LRLGYDDVGWELAEKVSTDDPYNVVAHNLVTLHESLRQFSMLTREDIHLRMDPREASIYGDEALQVLTDAKRVLSEKYQVELAEPVFVEIFPAQKDFAIRTFGLPGGDGYLGVCFGNVVTANSPASQGVRPYNWQSVLWHEFCHVITLNKTKNRMPRWLSEGISVYEERQRNPAWGEQMIPSYRTMILGKDLTPVSQLSSAFLRPPSPLHLQFAYFESSLVVEYLIERYGIDLIRQVLESLGDGMSINTSIEQTVGALDRLDVEFAEFARRRAQAFGFGADWESKAPSKASVDELLGWSKLHPTSYQILMQLADAQMRAEDYPAAKRTLERLVKLNIVSGERNGVLEKMAIVAGQLPLPKAEERAIHEWLAYSSDALPGLERLLELARKRNDWDEVARLGKEIIAIHPLKPVGHQAIVDAGEALDKPQWISRGIAAQMELDPVDMAGMQYRLAKSLALQGELEQAKRHVLRALAEAPRYRDAHQLLYQLTHKEPQ